MHSIPATTTPILILWTGGWDSTFQLLRMLLLERCSVLPIYVIDEDRRSTAIELRTLREIRRVLVLAHPEAAARLLPVRFHALSQIAPAPAVEEAFAQLRRKSTLGGQYAWLARLCEQLDIRDLQLGIHKGGYSDTLLTPMVEAAGAHGFRLRDEFAGTPEHAVFGRFTFPLLRMSKRDMQREATAHGWDALMALTWFCHRPRGGKACGVCNPCLFAIEQDMGQRIPPLRRALGRVLNWLEPARLWSRCALRWLRGRLRAGRRG